MTAEREQQTPLTTADIEYLFRAVKSDITSIRNRIKSLQNHFQRNGAPLGDTQDVGYPLGDASQALLTVSNRVATAERRALQKSMPHRYNDGEDPQW